MAQAEMGPFKFIGGELCFDFINTVGGRLSLTQIKDERLNHYRDLIDWARCRGLLAESESRKLERKAQSKPALATRWLRRSIGLRETIYRIFMAVIERGKTSSEDLKKLNEEFADLRLNEYLFWSSRGFELKWAGEVESFEFILWAVSRSVVDFLILGDRTRVKECPGADCHWLFVDTSRNASREWCSMQECGNREKVRRFRKRHDKSR